jgi:hypothetical protein
MIATFSPKKSLAPSLVLAGTVFAVLAFPLAVFGSQPIDIKLQKEPVFTGKLKDIAPPYLGLASLISVATGLAAVSVTGWQHSSSKADKAEQKLNELVEQLKAKEVQLQEALLSEPRLEAAGLDTFLSNQPMSTERSKMATTNVITSPKLTVVNQSGAEPTQQSQSIPSASLASLSASHAFFGFIRATEPSTVEEVSAKQEISVANIKGIQEQIKLLQTQIEALNLSLQAPSSLVSSQALTGEPVAQTEQTKGQAAYREPSWVVQKIA